MQQVNANIMLTMRITLYALGRWVLGHNPYGYGVYPNNDKCHRK